MISDTERREVAARLRYEESADPGCLNMIGEWYLVSFLQSINRAVDNGIEYRLRERLAGLIERPTCENGERLNERTFLCSACGYEAYTYSDSNCNPHDFSYCPDCGAEVMDE